MAQFADIKTILLRVVLIMILHKSISSLVTECNPDKKCETAKLGDKVVNPLDCQSYFICVKNSKNIKRASDVPIKCPDNQTFVDFDNPAYGIRYSNDKNQCMKNRKCDNLCLKTCTGECSNYYYEKIADVKDCSVFYTCSPDKIKVKTKCPPEAPYFDGVNCQESKYLCCSCCDKCTAFCREAYTQIADPYDCRSFYICEGKGLPKKENRHQCPEGQYYDKTKEKCETEDNLTPCTPLCKQEKD